MSKLPLLFALIILVSCAGPRHDQLTSFPSPQLPPPEGSPNLFTSYSPTGDAVMKEGWARGFDLSGVSFDQRMTATLITTRHVVMAKHYKRKLGSQVIFHNRNGKRLERTLTKVRAVRGDTVVGLLNLDVPADYHVYRLPAPREDYAQLVGQTAVITDQNRRLFFHKIQTVRPGGISFKYDREQQHGWGKKLISGDSGNPSFLISSGELVLIETHSTGGGGAGPFYGDPALQEHLQAAINKLAPGYRFQTKKLATSPPAISSSR